MWQTFCGRHRKAIMKVKYAMSENPHAISVGATVEEAAKVMTAFGVSLLPIIFEGRPVGVVSEHCLTTQVVAWARDPHRTPIRQVMNPSPTLLNENDDVGLARTVLEHSKEHRALVCRDDGTLAGVITLIDLEKASDTEAQSRTTDNGARSQSNKGNGHAEAF
jgi:CBS domain-containing protein